MWRSRALALIAAIVLVFAACGDDSGADTTTTTAAETTTSEAMDSTTTEAMAEFDARAEAEHGYATLAAGFTPDPLTVEVVAGGQVPASAVGCQGFATTAPDFEVDWSGEASLRFAFEAEGDADATLIVNGPEGEWHCGDDSPETPEPTIEFGSTESGMFDVWVASSEKGNLVTGELRIIEVDGGPDSDSTTTTTDDTSTSTTGATTTTTAATSTTAGTTSTTAGTTSTTAGTTSTTAGTTSTTSGGTTTTGFTIPSTTIPNITTTLTLLTTTTTTTIPVITTTFTIVPTTIPNFTTTTFTVPTIPNPFP